MNWFGVINSNPKQGVWTTRRWHINTQHIITNIEIVDINLAFWPQTANRFMCWDWVTKAIISNAATADEYFGIWSERFGASSLAVVRGKSRKYLSEFNYSTQAIVLYPICIYISILEVTERLSSSRGKYMGMNNSDTHTCTYAKSKIELFLSFRTNENSIRKNSSIWLCSLFHSHWLLRDGRYCSRTHKKNIPYSNYL